MTITEANVAVPDERKNQQQQPGRAPRHHNGRWSGFRHLLWARLLELKREPEVVFWVFLVPLLLATSLGLAVRNKSAPSTSVVVIDGAGARKTLAVLDDSAKNSPALVKVQATVLDRDSAHKGFRLGKFDLAIESNSDGSYKYYYDPARPESVLSRAAIDAVLQAAAGRKNMLTTSSQSATGPGSRYIDFLIPGLLGMSLMESGMWGVGFALVELRQRKLLRRFVATPMRRIDFLLALISSRLILNVIGGGLLLILGVLVFHLRMRGPIISVFLLTAVGALAFGGIGILAACRAQKVEGLSGLINLITMPMWIFSGVFFSYQRFPVGVQLLIKALPLTPLNDALRATITDGASLSSQTWRLLLLAIWGGISFTIALRSFRWS